MANHGTADNPLSSLSISLSDAYADSDKTYYVAAGGTVSLTGKATYPSYKASTTTGASGISVNSETGTASGSMPSGEVNVICIYKRTSQATGEIFTIKLVAPSEGPFEITTSLDPATAGTITPTSANVEAGGSQTFIIRANSGSYIYQVYVDGNTITPSGDFPTQYTYTFTDVHETHYIAASFFGLPGYTITASAGSGGSISPSGSVSVARGENKAFVVSADSNYKISTLKVDGAKVSGASGRTSYTYTFYNVTEAHTIAATFTYVPPTVYHTITASATTGGTVSPSGSVSVEDGYSKSFTASPSSGYRLSHWVVDGSTGGSNLTYTFSNVTANHTIQAVFVKTYTVQATAPAHGSVTISATGYTPQTAQAGQTASLVVDTGTSVTFACTMETGYNFSAWTEDGSTVSSEATYTATITSNKTLVATEAASSYIITATASEGGTISPSGEVSVNHGANQTFTATPATGYRFDHWVVDGQIEPDQ